MKRFDVEHVESTKTVIYFRIIMENIKPDDKSTIILNIYKENILNRDEKPKKIGNSFLKYPFKEVYSLDKLPSGTSFKLNFFLTVKNDAYMSKLFASTLLDTQKLLEKPKRVIKEEDEKEAKKKQLSVTENLLYTYTQMTNGDVGIFDGKKDIKRNILNARHSEKWKDYQNDCYKFARPKFNREKRAKRMLLIANGMQAFEDVYGLGDKDKGFRILEGDWFMGPFYAYNDNLKKKPNDLSDLNTISSFDY